MKVYTCLYYISHFGLVEVNAPYLRTQADGVAIIGNIASYVAEKREPQRVSIHSWIPRSNTLYFYPRFLGQNGSHAQTLPQANRDTQA